MKLAEEVKRGIAADRKAGMSVKEVSAKYGVNKSTIAKYARAAEEVQSVEVPTTLDLEVDLGERAIKHASKFSGTSEPEVRLLMLFGMTLLQTDATNRLRERMPASAPTETAEKYADL